MPDRPPLRAIAPLTRARLDIQFLRGVAVLLVMAFHAVAGAAPQGFLGVDIFFVISGFLVGLMILKELEAGRFSFLAFYLRRARRILPAAFSTFLATTLIAYFVLTSPQWASYLRQLLGALAFSANMVLAGQQDYFAPAAEAMPLLHIWSLSLEEQFYFLIPLLLFAAPPTWRLPLLAAAALLSLLLCLALARDWPRLAFYLLPTRAWELLVGCLCGWISLHRPVRIPRAVQAASFIAILLVCLVGVDPVHPRGDALIAVAATGLILLGEDKWLPRHLVTKAVGVVGDWSYSLYLIHWPLLTFAFIASAGSPTPPLIAGALILSLFAAWAQYSFVETPFRKTWSMRTPRLPAAFSALTLAMGLAALPAAVRGTTADSSIPRANRGLPGCVREGAADAAPPACRTSNLPRVAVWGDSFAMHLVAGLAADPAIGGSLIQLTRARCPPLAGVAAISRSSDRDEAARCLRFNEAVLRRLVSSPVRAVVISSPFSQVFTENGQALLVDGAAEEWSHIGPSRLARAIRLLKAAGKTPILVAPTPMANFDVGDCNVRAMQGLLLIGRTGCSVREADLRPGYRAILGDLERIARQTGTPLFVPETILCSRGICVTRRGNRLIYRNEGHLTGWGSRYVVSRLGIVPAVRQAAGFDPR